MFFLRRPAESVIQEFLIGQRRAGFSYPEVGATGGRLPDRYTIDRNSARLGSGADVFRIASECLRKWRMFDLQGVEVVPARTPIEAGRTLAVLARHFGFWSLNACRIVYVFEESRRYGFAYGTLDDHSETGEERFSVEWALEDDSVTYTIVAFSRPHKWPVKVAWPLGRLCQTRFARGSMEAMARSVRNAAVGDGA
jgi:uncharacterized protein (UPF0548 family)